MKNKVLSETKIKKAIKLRLYPSKVKQNQINQIREICLWLYNVLGKERVKAWKESKTIITYSQQQNSLPSLKENNPNLKLVHSQTLQEIVRRLDYSWKKFYTKVRKKSWFTKDKMIREIWKFYLHSKSSLSVKG